MKRFFTIEYVDDEGDLVVKHALLSTKERDVLLDEFAHRGMAVEIYDLTPPQVIEKDSAVLCGDATSKLERGS